MAGRYLIPGKGTFLSVTQHPSPRTSRTAATAGDELVFMRSHEVSFQMSKSNQLVS